MFRTLCTAAGLILLSSAAIAETSKVEMLSVHPETSERMVFYPELVRIEPGDTVTWLPTDKGHNVEFVKGGVPDGVETFRSGFNKEVSFTFDKPGVYVYKCTPHYGLGMIGVVVVGDEAGNLEEVRDLRVPGVAKPRAEELFSQL